MKVIGLTGGIGTGKSTVSEMLKQLGAVVIDADKLGHEVFKPHTAAWDDVVQEFGGDVVNAAGEIDRARLGAIVFNDPEQLKKLNEIMHPRMLQIVQSQIADYRKKGEKAVVLEAFGLIEAGWKPAVDEVWVAVSPERAVVERLRAQRGLDEEQILSRIRSQTPSEERVKHADVVINNEGDISTVREQVAHEWERLTATI